MRKIEWLDSCYVLSYRVFFFISLKVLHFLRLHVRKKNDGSHEL